MPAGLFSLSLEVVEGADQNILYQENIKTSNEERLQLIDDVMKFFEQNKIKLKVDQYELHLILDEAITNSMEHGNRWNEDKSVRVRIREPEKDKITVDIKDEGIGFNPNIVPSILNANGKLNPRGRGIYIIKRFCGASWNNLGNEITLTFEKED